MKKYLVVLLGIFCFYFIGCNSASNKVAHALAKKCKAGNGTVINIAELTDYQWDRLYIFGPYAYGEFIQKIVEQDFLTPSEIKKLKYGLSEVDSMFVFTNKGKVVDHFVFSTIPTDFTVFDGFNYFSIENGDYDKNSFPYINKDKFSCFTPLTAKFRKEGNELKLDNK